MREREREREKEMRREREREHERKGYIKEEIKGKKRNTLTEAPLVKDMVGYYYR